MGREISFRMWEYKSKTMTYDCLPMRDGLENPDFEFMQYTGLKDRNGVKIFEGDIITWGGPKCIVTYGTIMAGDDKEGTGWIASDGKEINMWSDCFIDGDCHIIGNKFENPELLNTTEGKEAGE